jgi:hypothetical protein
VCPSCGGVLGWWTHDVERWVRIFDGPAVRVRRSGHGAVRAGRRMCCCRPAGTLPAAPHSQTRIPATEHAKLHAVLTNRRGTLARRHDQPHRADRRISRDERDQRSSRYASSVPERERSDPGRGQMERGIPGLPPVTGRPRIRCAARGRAIRPESAGTTQDGRALLRGQVITGFQQAGQQLRFGGEGTK